MKHIKQNKRFKKTQQEKVVIGVSFGKDNRFNIFSEESLIKINKLQIKENDFVVIFDTQNGERSLGKVISKKPLGLIPKGQKLSENIIMKRATWFDKLLDKMRLL